MAEKVTLWKASDGMHYATQGEAEMADARAELIGFLREQGLPEGALEALVRASLAVRYPPDLGSPEDQAGERGARVFARFAATVERYARNLPGEKGSREEAQAALKAPEPVPVAEPVRRRGIRAPAEPVPAIEGPSPRRAVDFDRLPRPHDARGWSPD